MVLALGLEEWRGTNFMERDSNRSYEEKVKRDEEIFSAMLMGNNYGQDITLNLDTEEGPRTVNARIWATTEKHLILHSGAQVPRKSVLEVLD